MILGIDFSTARVGLAVMDAKGKIFNCDTFDLSKTKSHKERRKILVKRANEFIHDYACNVVIIEKVRLFHHGFISLATIERLVQMSGAIIDGCPVPVYSIDTRSWKKAVLGSAKATKDDSVAYVNRVYQMEVNHDLADAICIARAPQNKHCRSLMRRET